MQIHRDLENFFTRHSEKEVRIVEWMKTVGVVMSGQM